MAGVGDSAAIVEINNNFGGMLSGDDLEFFSKMYRLPMVSIGEIINLKNSNNTNVLKYSTSKLPTAFGDFEITVWVNANKEELVVLSKGNLEAKRDNIPLRLHSRCATGDVFHSLKCDCKDQLHIALKYINEVGVGLLLYLDQEGRGIGLADKILSYSKQDEGMDTIDANLALGVPVDARDYGFAIEVLKQYNLSSIELLTNNPLKISALKLLYKDNIKVKSITAKANKYNEAYLKVKKNKMSHFLDIT